MNPGNEEDLQGVPFIGPSGHLLRNVYILPSLVHLHFTVYFTNLARCTTPHSKPRISEYRTCSSAHLMRDIQALSLHHRPHPPIYLATGHDPAIYLRRFLEPPSPRDPFSTLLVRQPISLPDGARMFVTFHPAALLRNRDKLGAIAHHMGLMHSHLISGDPIPNCPIIRSPVPLRRPSHG